MNWAGDSALIPARAKKKFAERLLSGRSALSEPVQFYDAILQIYDAILQSLKDKPRLRGGLRLLDPLQNH